MAKTTRIAAAGKRAAGRLAGRRVLLHSFTRGHDRSEANRFEVCVKAYGAALADALDVKVNYLVYPGPSLARAVRKQVEALNARGADVRALDAADFSDLLEPTAEDVLWLIRGGADNAPALGFLRYAEAVSGTRKAPALAFTGENFNGLDLSGFTFDGIAFERCGFVGATLNATTFDVARDCDFSRAAGGSTEFKDVRGSRFAGAALKSASFDGLFGGADFSGARLDGCVFNDLHVPPKAAAKKHEMAGVSFRKAVIPAAFFDNDILLDRPDFSGADLTGCRLDKALMAGADFSGAKLTGCRLQRCGLSGSSFRGATMKDAVLYDCRLPDCDFTGADLRNANAAESDLSGGRFDGADLTGCNLRGANLDRANPSAARGYGGVPPSPAAGPALKSLDAAARKAARLDVEFLLGSGEKAFPATVGGSAKWGYAARLGGPADLDLRDWANNRKQPFSAALARLTHAAGHLRVRFETFKVTAAGAPLSVGGLRDLAVRAVSEAFGQAPPDAAALAAAAKAHRAAESKVAAARRQRQAAERAARQKRELEARARAVARVTREVGRVGDFDSFMKAILARTAPDKVANATKMLRAERFKLFSDASEGAVSGVVKSQSNAGLVYACRIDAEGRYACCTQNLNACGGQRGAVCKHLLVLLIGLVKAGELGPATIDAWVGKTHGVKPELDKEKMGDIFIRYKGAEAGEVDWRPTETVPEDYYAL